MTDSDLNLGPVLNLTHRLSPFILIWFFILSTCFNGIANGIVYICGLIITCMVTGGIGFISGGLNPTNNNLCYIINLTGSNRYLSGVPLSLVVITYTFVYLLYPIVRYNNVPSHIATVTVLPILILSEIFWLLRNKCVHIINILLALTFTCLITALYAHMIDKSEENGYIGNIDKEGKHTQFLYSIGPLNKKCVVRQNHA